MSDSQPTPTPRRSPAVKALGLIAGICAIVAGIYAVSDGLRDIAGAGGDASKASAMLQAASRTVDQANQLTLEGAPLLQAVLDEVNTNGLTPAREKEQDTAARAIDLFGQAAERFRSAGQQLSEAAGLGLDENVKAYCQAKAEAYGQYATTKAGAKEILLLVLDEQVKDQETLLLRLQGVNSRIDAANQAGNEAAARADAIAAKHPELFKP